MRKVLVLLALLAVSGPAWGQTPAPAPVSSTLSFSLGAGAFGLGGANQASAASDVTLALDPGISKLKGFRFRSDNLLSPGSNLQYYGGGVDYTLPVSFPQSSPLSPLSFYAQGTVGVVRIVPASGPTQSSVGFLAGGGLRWKMANGIQVSIVEIDVLHAPHAPWGNNAPAVSGGISYVWGKQ